MDRVGARVFRGAQDLVDDQVGLGRSRPAQCVRLIGGADVLRLAVNCVNDAPWIAPPVPDAGAPTGAAMQAGIDDVGGILELIEPMEQAGVLVKRSRELLEQEIERFCVVERDGTVIACAALYPFTHEAIAEVACVAVHPGYRDAGRGDTLLQFIEARSREQGMTALFVLSTRTAHWFRERGFQTASVERLPQHKRQKQRLDVADLREHIEFLVQRVVLRHARVENGD